MKRPLKHILLIDDDCITNTFNKMMICKANLTEKITIAQNGLEGLKLIETMQDEIDIILLDINMPIATGWEVIEALQINPTINKDKLCIFMLSSSQASKDIEYIKQFNFVHDYLIKPLKIDTLLEAIEQKKQVTIL